MEMNWDPAGIVSVVQIKETGTSYVRESSYMLKEDCRWDRTNTSKHSSIDMTVAQYWHWGLLSYLFEHHSSNPKAHLLYLCHSYCKTDTICCAMEPLLLVRATCAAHKEESTMPAVVISAWTSASTQVLPCNQSPVSSERPSLYAGRLLSQQTAQRYHSVRWYRCLLGVSDNRWNICIVAWRKNMANPN